METNKTKRRMIIMLLVVGIVFGGIFLWKGILKVIIRKTIASQKRSIFVSAMPVQYSLWESKIQGTGSLRAVKGVNVTTELAGMVDTIYFKQGSIVKKDTLLVQLRNQSDLAQLQALQANADLAKTTYERDKKQYDFHAISKQALETSTSNYRSALAQVAQQQAIVNKKAIRAPFEGQLGISLINPGQFINPGDKIVSLQTLDPIYVDFFTPQQTLASIKTGQPITVTTNTYPGKKYKGVITTIDSQIDPATRNIGVQGTIENSTYELTPGMFVSYEVVVGNPRRFLTLPQTAITFNPYGDVVYIIKQTGKDEKGEPILIANQVFVVTGETRGDQISILKGLKEGETIVTSGQLKLKNGAQVIINNEIVPSNNPTPTVSNEG